MKQCDHLATIASSSPSFPPSESDPDDSFWRDFTFDFSFLTSDDHKTVPKELELTGADSNVTIVEERSPPPPPPPSSSVLGVTGEACSRNESAFSPLFAKMSALGVKECSNECDEDESEVDSPCWKGTWSKSLRSRDDLSVLYGLNPMAPQFIPSNAMMKNGKDEFGENGSPSLKRSLSSTFPPSSSSGAFSISNLYEAGIEQTNSILHDAEDESLGLVCQEDSVSDISNQFQRRVKLDPLAPVFVPAYAVDKSGLADHMIAAERNASSEVGHIGSNPYSSNPQLGSQVRISENTKLDSSSSKTHGSKKKLNPLAPQFSLADTKPKAYGSMENNVNTSVLFSPASYRNNQELLHGGLTQPSVHVGPSYKEVDTNQMGRYRSMDVKKLLTTIHGLSELLTHVHGSDTSGSPNEQDLDLINSTVQNLNSYIKNNGVTGQYDGVTSLPNMCKLLPYSYKRKQSISEHTIPKARSLSPSVDFKRKEKYPMVLGAEPQVEYGVTKESGFGQGLRNHQTGEQINPHVLFYKSLWLKARADKSLMEYETFLSNSRT